VLQRMMEPRTEPRRRIGFHSGDGEA
jgi:hypothetical protein